MFGKNDHGRCLSSPQALNTCGLIGPVRGRNTGEGAPKGPDGISCEWALSLWSDSLTSKEHGLPTLGLFAYLCSRAVPGRSAPSNLTIYRGVCLHPSVRVRSYEYSQILESTHGVFTYFLASLVVSNAP